MGDTPVRFGCVRMSFNPDLCKSIIIFDISFGVTCAADPMRSVLSIECSDHQSHVLPPNLTLVLHLVVFVCNLTLVDMTLPSSVSKRSRAATKCSKCARIKKRKVVTDDHELDNIEARERYVFGTHSLLTSRRSITMR